MGCYVGLADSAVEASICNAWNIAEDSVKNAESYARQATYKADDLRDADRTIVDPVDLEIPDRDLIEITKLQDLEKDVDDILKGLPADYDMLYRGLATESGRSIWKNLDFSAKDAVDVVGTLSNAFNQAFAFSDGVNFADHYKNTAAWLLADTVYGGDIQFGLSAHVEQAIRERSVQALDNESIRAENDLIASIAARGFPMPSGAINQGLEMIRDKAMQAKSQAIRDVWIEQQKLAYEATFKYLDLFMESQKAVQALFIDYLKVCVDARNATGDDMTSLIDAVTKLREAMLKFYTQLYDDREIYLKEAIAEHELGQKWHQINSSEYQNRINAMVSAASSSANVMGQLAAAAVSSQNSMVSLAEQTINSAI
jgi:hypothetical protein